MWDTVRRATHVLTAVAGLVAAVVVGAAPAQAAPQAGLTARPAMTVAGNTVDGAVSARDAANYWTPERMRAATPAELPAVKGDLGAQPAPTSGAVVLGSDGKTPLADDKTRSIANLSAVGRVFFVDPRDGRQHYCSGSLLQSNNAKMMLTAGHCTTESGTQMLQLTFAPDYPRNTTTYGAQWFVIPNRWLYESVTGYDYSIVVLGQPVGVAFGGNPLVYNAPTSGMLVDAFGYPGSGATLMLCTGFTTSYTTSVHQVGLPCPQNVLDKGSSGGPWIVQSNGVEGYVNGVNANFYPFVPDVLFTPYFDDLTADMWIYAETVLSV